MRRSIRGPTGRRRFLKITGSAVSASVLAGCTGGDESDGGSDGGGGDGGGGSDGGGGDGGGASTDGSLSAREKLIANAEEEGELVILSPGVPEAWNEKFTADTGIDVTMSSLRKTNAITRLLNEHNSNQMSIDLHGNTDAIAMGDIAQRGIYGEPGDVLREGTVWHEGVLGERTFEIDLGWLMATEQVPPEEQPTSWEEMTNGDYSLTIDTGEEEYVVAWEELHGTDRARELCEMVAEVSTFKESHSTATQEILAGHFDGGVLKYDDLYESEQKGLLYPLEEIARNSSPYIALPFFMAKTAKAPNPNAAEYYYLYWLENYADWANEQFQPIEWYKPKWSPADAEEAMSQGSDLFKLGYEHRDVLEDARIKYEHWTGLKDHSDNPVIQNA